MKHQDQRLSEPEHCSLSATYDPIWALTVTDRPLVEAKRLSVRLRFAVMLLFLRAKAVSARSG